MGSPSSPYASTASTRNYRRITTERLRNSIAGNSCPICLCHVEHRRAAVIIPCMHAYCIECIRKWSNLKRSCPLCNADFGSWFFQINLSSQTFRTQKLLELPVKGKNVISSDGSRRGRSAAEQLRLIRRYRQEFSASSSRTRQLPWRRSFRRQVDEHPDLVTERVCLWRASIYEQRVQAVQFASRNCLRQQIMASDDAKKRVLERIEPWIQRELCAILGDPDPSVIVHVVTSLFFSIHEEKHGPLGQVGVEHDSLAPLRPFLHEKTEMFWHELRCFAESSFSMEVYDGVVEYTRPLE